MSSFDYLFASRSIKGMSVPSRLCLAPINTGFAVRGDPTVDLIRFHRLRSGPEIGVSMVGNVAVSRDAVTNSGTACLESGSSLSVYDSLAATIKQQGSLPGIQLAGSPVLNPARKWVVASRSAERDRLKLLIHGYSDLELGLLLSKFCASVRLAVSAGFEIVQIHAAHGYLLSLLLNPHTNSRVGYFSLQGPWFADFVQDFVHAANTAIVGIRVSLFSGLENDKTEELAFTRMISDLAIRCGVSLIDYSAGFYTVDRRLVYPGVEHGVLPYLTDALNAAFGLRCMVGVSGNIQHLAELPMISDNVFLSIGRALIADPDMLKKYASGQSEIVRACCRRAKCHYFSRGRNHLECGVNPDV